MFNNSLFNNTCSKTDNSNNMFDSSNILVQRFLDSSFNIFKKEKKQENKGCNKNTSVFNRFNILNSELLNYVGFNNDNVLTLDPKYKFLQFYLLFFILSVIILLIALLNSNIICLIKMAKNNPDILDKWFPSDCLKSPYGPQYITDKSNSAIEPGKKSVVRDLCGRSDTTASCNSIPAEHGAPDFDTNHIYDYFYKDSEKSWPYTWFNSNDDINIFEDYLNYTLRSTALTSTNVNGLIKRGLTMLSNITNRFLLVILGLIILFIITIFIIPLITYYLFIMVNQIALLFNVNTQMFTKIAIFFSGLILMGGLNPIYSMSETVCLLFKFMCYPLLMGGYKKIFNIMIENKDIIAFILGFYYVLCAKKTLSNKMYTTLNYLYFITLLSYILIKIISSKLNNVFSLHNII